MVDKPFVPDHPEDWIYIGLALSIAVIGFSYFTTLDGQARALYRENIGYFSSPEANLTFNEEQVDRLNWGSQSSVGFEAVGDERLYCLVVNDGIVSNVRFADTIEESDRVSISGACYDQFGDVDGFIHTQPDGSDELSDEDKNLESATQYSCIQYDEIVESPTGKVSGLKCWDISGTLNDPIFTEIEVGISE